MKKWFVLLLAVAFLISTSSLMPQAAYGKKIKLIIKEDKHGAPQPPPPGPGPKHPGPPGPGPGPKPPGPPGPGPKPPGPPGPGPKPPGPPGPGPKPPGPPGPGPKHPGPPGPGPKHPGPPGPGPKHVGHYGPKPYYRPDFNDRRRLQDDARFIIHRTFFVVAKAQQAAGRHHYFAGLGDAIAYQDWARNLFWRGQYREAIFNSMRARNIAYQIIRENQERWTPDYDWDDMENSYMPYMPKDDDPSFQIKIRRYSDKESLFLKLNLDLD